MITIYIANISRLQDQQAYRECCELLNEDELANILRIRSEKSRLRSLLGRYLLRYALQERNGRDKCLEADRRLFFRYGEQGKPYLADHPDIHFNISHSGDYAACAVADYEIGMDLQQKKNYHENIAARFFADEEKKMLAACLAGQLNKEQQAELFFELWSIKESYVKLTGRGLSQGLDTFAVQLAQNTIIDYRSGITAYFSARILLQEYYLAVSAYQSLLPEEIRVCVI